MSDEQTKPVTMPPTDVVTTRLDGWLAPEVDPDHPPSVIEAMLLIPHRDDADEVEAIRWRMIARHAAGFGGGDG
jgi:hypothetical protein